MTDLTQPDPRTCTADEVIAYANANMLGGAQHSMAACAGVLQAFVHFLASERDYWRKAFEDARNDIDGSNAEPTKGSSLAQVSIGDSTVTVEYEFDPGEPADYGYGSRYPTDGAAPSVAVTDVWINGGWCRAIDAIDSEQVEKWEQELLDRELEKLSDDRDADRIEAYEARKAE